MTTANYQAGLYKEYQTLMLKHEHTSETLRHIKYEYQLLESKHRTIQRQVQQLAAENEKKEVENQALRLQVARLGSQLNLDAANSGLPTSQTPIHKKKVIPNSRQKTGKKIGGQPGHSRHKLSGFSGEEVNEIIEHTLKQCPHCASEQLKQRKVICKDELDYKVIVEKKRHRFYEYKCECCGECVREKIPNHLKEENQYGPQVRATALSLMNQANVPINKVNRLIRGFSGQQIDLSEGYIASLQKKAAAQLEMFHNHLRNELVGQSLVYWDDTVIMVDKKRACLRFYGTEKLALYKAHLKKDKAGLDEDRVLSLLPEETIVEHDHNKVNYNKEYLFRNAECNVHLLRELTNLYENTNQGWAHELHKLLTKTNQKRTEYREKGKDSFTVGESQCFFERFEEIMLKAYEEHKSIEHGYYEAIEERLITRILDYKNEYLLWVVDFEVPFTNNLSERSLRGVKSKMKASGQFRNEESATQYASIKTYIETCYRHQVNEFDALMRLCLREPYTLKELQEKSEK